MTSFPVFERLTVDEYLLYPGRDVSSEHPEAIAPDSHDDHFEASFSPGPWIILGVNGLGKSTLLLLLKQVLVGAVRARDAGFTGERSDMLTLDPRFFAVRVSDGARSASAELSLRIGATNLKIRRRLSDLSFQRGWITQNSEDAELSNEGELRIAITEAMGLQRFEDVVRVVDRIVFFLETRSPLIWDVSAQFEIFRALLTPQHSAELRRLESEIVSNDSAARNLNATIYKLTQRRDRQIRLIETSANTQAQIAVATANRDKWRAEESRLQAQLEKADSELSDARLLHRRAERDADAAASRYEELKYKALRHAFAGVTPNDQYVLLKIMADKFCIACGNPAESAAQELEARRSEGRCLVCGSQRHAGSEVIPTSSALRRRAEQAYGAMGTARAALTSTTNALREAQERRRSLAKALDAAREAVDQEDAQLRKLHRKLPAADRAALSREEDRIEGLRREVLAFRADRNKAEEEISGLLQELTHAAVHIRNGLEEAFLARAEGFFAESVRLVYAPRRDRIGQSGRLFDFPAFEVEMTSGATQGEFVRRSREQVSLSQREYLDLIFRMSLLESLSGGPCSLVVDGPEGSLDAVFAARAGDLFSAFARSREGNVILACNIIEGAFLPNTLRAFRAEALRRDRVINLLENAAPTAALRELRPAYRAAVDEILRAEPRSL